METRKLVARSIRSGNYRTVRCCDCKFYHFSNRGSSRCGGYKKRCPKMGGFKSAMTNPCHNFKPHENSPIYVKCPLSGEKIRYEKCERCDYFKDQKTGLVICQIGKVMVDVTPHAKGRIFQRFNVNSEQKVKKTLRKAIEEGEFSKKEDEDKNLVFRRFTVGLVGSLEDGTLHIITAYNLSYDSPRQFRELKGGDSPFKVKEIDL